MTDAAARDGSIPAIDVETLATWRRDGRPHALVDVREPWERDISHVEGGLAMPMGEVPDRMGELPADVTLVVMCRSGGRSARVTAYLRDRGMDAVNLAGGINAWASRVDPDMPTY